MTQETILSLIKILIGPALGVFGFFYYMITKNRSLEDKLKQSEAEKQVAKVVNEYAKQDEKVDNLHSEYQSAKSEYDASRK